MDIAVFPDRHWASRHYIVAAAKENLEHEVGSYKAYCDDNDPRHRDYPLRGVTYPVRKGHLPDYVGEDNEPLDAFVGASVHGENGRFCVWRDDIDGGRETKFFFGLSSPEKTALIETYASIVIGTPVTYASPEELETELEKYRPEAMRFKRAMVKAMVDDMIEYVENHKR